MSGIFHLIILDHGWPQVTGTANSEIADKGRLTTVQRTQATAIAEALTLVASINPWKALRWAMAGREF